VSSQSPAHPRPLAPEAGNRGTLSRHQLLALAGFAFACLLSIAVYPGTWQSMIHVWWTSDTYAHGFIALPCAAWMIWRRNADWRATPQRAYWPALVVILACGALWMVGHLAGIASIEQIAAVASIPAVLLLLFGPALVVAWVFPLAFLFFAVPIGDFLLPTLMDHTARATVTALRWTGVPVYQEGLHFTLPTGRWSVIEACSGLRYLVASLALGVLYAYLQFRTTRYRLAFIALALIVPIVANWVRAYLTVMLGHLVSMDVVAGFIHIVYGWVFFGIVMALLFWIGSGWHEAPNVEDRESTQSRETNRFALDSIARRGWRPLVAPALVAALALAAWRPVSATLLDLTAPVPMSQSIATALSAYPVAPSLDFSPRFSGARESVRSARRVGDGTVEFHLDYYARQHETAEMVHAVNQVVASDDFRWPIRTRLTEHLPFGAVASYRLGRIDRDDLLVWHWYAVAGLQSESAYAAKAMTAWSIFTGHGDHSITVTLVTRVEPGDSTIGLLAARKRLAEAAAAIAPSVDSLSRGAASVAHRDSGRP